MPDHWPLKPSQSPLATVILGAKSLVYTIWYSCVQQLHRRWKEKPLLLLHTTMRSVPLRCHVFAPGCSLPSRCSALNLLKVPRAPSLDELIWKTGCLDGPPSNFHSVVLGCFSAQCPKTLEPPAASSSQVKVACHIFDPCLALQLW